MSTQPARKRPSARQVWDALTLWVGIGIFAAFVAPFIITALGAGYLFSGTFWRFVFSH